MVVNSPAFQRRDCCGSATSPAGTTEIECASRPSGTYPSRTSNPALKRRAIIVSPSGTEAAHVTSKPSGRRAAASARPSGARATPRAPALPDASPDSADLSSSVGQTSLSAGSGDFPVPSSILETVLETTVNPQARKPELLAVDSLNTPDSADPPRKAAKH